MSSVKDKIKVKKEINSGTGFLSSLGYKVEGAVQATYKCPFKAQEMICFEKPLPLLKRTEEESDESFEIKKVRKHASIGTDSRHILIKKNERDQYTMQEYFTNKWMEDEAEVSSDEEEKEFFVDNYFPPSAIKMPDTGEVISASSHSLERIKRGSKAKIKEAVRRRSCECTGCHGKFKKPRRKGDLIVLDNEVDIIRKLQKELQSKLYQK